MGKRFDLRNVLSIVACVFAASIVACAFAAPQLIWQLATQAAGRQRERLRTTGRVSAVHTSSNSCDGRC
jgi:hypothetical protein